MGMLVLTVRKDKKLTTSNKRSLPFYRCSDAERNAPSHPYDLSSRKKREGAAPNKGRAHIIAGSFPIFTRILPLFKYFM